MEGYNEMLRKSNVAMLDNEIQRLKLLRQVNEYTLCKLSDREYEDDDDIVVEFRITGHCCDICDRYWFNKGTTESEINMAFLCFILSNTDASYKIIKE